MSGLGNRETSIVSDIILAASTDVLTSDTWTRILSLMEQIIPAHWEGVVFHDSEQYVLRNISEEAYRDAIVPYLAYCQSCSGTTVTGQGSHVWRLVDFTNQKQVPANLTQLVGFMTHHGIQDVMTTCLRSGDQVYAHLWLARLEANHPFTRQEAQLLELLRPHLSDAFRRGKLLEELKQTNESLRAGMDQFDRPIFMLSDQAELLQMNNSGANLCNEFDSSGIGGWDSIRAAAVRLIEKKLSSSHELDYPSGVKLVLGNKTYMLEASSVSLSNSPRYWVVVAVDMTDHLTKALVLAMKTYELSQRESEVCTMLVAGLSNREIAERLFITEFTVKDHIKRIFEKLGVTSRSKVAGSLLGF